MSGRLLRGRSRRLRPGGTPPRRRQCRRATGLVVSIILGAVAGGLGSGCGPRSSDDQWAAVLVDTCRSIIARARLRNPTPAELNAQRFLDERNRLLSSGRSFNTVSAFRNVCGAVRDEITTESTTSTTLSEIPAGPAADRTPP